MTNPIRAGYLFLGSHCHLVIGVYWFCRLFHDDPATSARFSHLDPRDRSHAPPCQSAVAGARCWPLAGHQVYRLPNGLGSACSRTTADWNSAGSKRRRGCGRRKERAYSGGGSASASGAFFGGRRGPDSHEVGMVECERKALGSDRTAHADEIRVDRLGFVGEPPARRMRATRRVFGVAGLSDRRPWCHHSCLRCVVVSTVKVSLDANVTTS